MSRYEPLRQYLVQLPSERREVRLTFDEIETIVGPLPPSARDLRTWWGNSADGQALSWQAAGWKVDSVNLTAEIVVFVRGQAIRRTIGPPVVRQRFEDPPAFRLHSSEAHGEAEVQARVVAYLAAEGWLIRRVADTASREQGFDILAVKDGRTMVVEAKGIPSRAYTDPRQRGETDDPQQSGAAVVLARAPEGDADPRRA